jgi:SAM-dependent methyltransferase
MTSRRLKEHYESKYAHESAGSARTVALTAHPANRLEACLLYMSRSFKGGNILEVGAGDGTIARSILEAGIPFDSYTITDLSETRARSAAKSLGDKRFHGFALDIETGLDAMGGRKFEAIIMVALIEHLIDPIVAMKGIRDLLGDDAFVYIDTPNIAKYTRRVKLLLGRFPSTASTDEGLTTYGGKPVDLYDEGHLHYWTFRSLEEMLSRYCGLTRFERAPYSYQVRLPRRIAHHVARLWPEAFSELAVSARK